MQEELGRAEPPPWRPDGAPRVGGVFVCFARGGDSAWAAAALADVAVITGTAGGGYEPGLLALRDGALLEQAVRALEELPDVLLVDATGRDHPRRAGLALHLGAVLDVPTVGVTHRPLLARGDWPDDERGARSPLLLGADCVGYWVRTRPGTRPLAVHAAWRTSAEAAVDVVMSVTGAARTPEPLRRARRAARTARAAG